MTSAPRYLPGVPFEPNSCYGTTHADPVPSILRRLAEVERRLHDIECRPAPPPLNGKPEAKVVLCKGVKDRAGGQTHLYLHVPRDCVENLLFDGWQLIAGVEINQFP